MGGAESTSNPVRNMDKRTARREYKNDFERAIRDYVVKLPSFDSNQNIGKLNWENGNIRVCVRKRPIFSREVSAGEFDVVTCCGPGTAVIHDARMHSDMKRRFINNIAFDFDKVFNEKARNEDVYSSAALPLVEFAYRGGNATCMVYGQTGSGKTFTMSSIYKFAADDMFRLIHENTARFSQEPSVAVSFFEIAGDTISDLLNGYKPSKLIACVDGTVQPFPIVEVPVADASELIAMINHGRNIRSTAATGVHESSSRSHAILRIYVQKLRDLSRVENRHEWTEDMKYEEGVLTLVDLAGSEHRIDSMYHSADRRKECAMINSSLMALKDCIRARSIGKNMSHQYRKSKLTMALKGSFFMPESRTVVIATVSPSSKDTEHSLNTLRHACIMDGQDNESDETRFMTGGKVTTLELGSIDVSALAKKAFENKKKGITTDPKTSNGNVSNEQRNQEMTPKQKLRIRRAAEKRSFTSLATNEKQILTNARSQVFNNERQNRRIRVAMQELTRLQEEAEREKQQEEEGNDDHNDPVDDDEFQFDFDADNVQEEIAVVDENYYNNNNTNNSTNNQANPNHVDLHASTNELQSTSNMIDCTEDNVADLFAKHVTVSCKVINKPFPRASRKSMESEQKVSPRGVVNANTVTANINNNHNSNNSNRVESVQQLAARPGKSNNNNSSTAPQQNSTKSGNSNDDTRKSPNKIYESLTSSGDGFNPHLMKQFKTLLIMNGYEGQELTEIISRFQDKSTQFQQSQCEEQQVTPAKGNVGSRSAQSKRTSIGSNSQSRFDSNDNFDAPPAMVERSKSSHSLQKDRKSLVQAAEMELEKDIQDKNSRFNAVKMRREQMIEQQRNKLMAKISEKAAHCEVLSSGASQRGHGGQEDHNESISRLEEQLSQPGLTQVAAHGLRQQIARHKAAILREMNQAKVRETIQSSQNGGDNRSQQQQTGSSPVKEEDLSVDQHLARNSKEAKAAAMNNNNSNDVDSHYSPSDGNRTGRAMSANARNRRQNRQQSEPFESNNVDYGTGFQENNDFDPYTGKHQTSQYNDSVPSNKELYYNNNNNKVASSRDQDGMGNNVSYQPQFSRPTIRAIRSEQQQQGHVSSPNTSSARSSQLIDQPKEHSPMTQGNMNRGGNNIGSMDSFRNSEIPRQGNQQPSRSVPLTSYYNDYDNSNFNSNINHTSNNNKELSNSRAGPHDYSGYGSRSQGYNQQDNYGNENGNVRPQMYANQRGQGMPMQGNNNIGNKHLNNNSNGGPGLDSYYDQHSQQQSYYQQPTQNRGGVYRSSYAENNVHGNGDYAPQGFHGGNQGYYPSNNNQPYAKPIVNQAQPPAALSTMNMNTNTSIASNIVSRGRGRHIGAAAAPFGNEYNS